MGGKEGGVKLPEKHRFTVISKIASLLGLEWCCLSRDGGLCEAGTVEGHVPIFPEYPPEPEPTRISVLGAQRYLPSIS